MVVIRALLAEHREGMRQLIRENEREPTMPIVQPELNEEMVEEGNYSQTVSQSEPPLVRRNQPDSGNDGCECKYKDFMASKPQDYLRT